MKISRQVLSNITILFWLITIPFSHAPGFKHSAFTLSGIMTTIVICIYSLPAIYYSIKISRGGLKIHAITFPLVFFIFYIILAIISVLSANELHEKFFNYGMAYIWFFLAFIVFSYKGLVNKISDLKIAKLLCVILFSTCLFSLVEYSFHFIHIDIGSYFVRPDRINYFYNHPVLGYRVRAFNYESANLALLANVFFLSIIVLLRKSQDWIFKLSFISWVIILFLAWSSAALLISVPIFLYALIVLIKSKTYLLSILILFLFVTLYLFLGNEIHVNFDGLYIIYDKMVGYLGYSDKMVSANIRNDLFSVGWTALSENWSTGLGLAGFYFISDTGLNNIYLMMGVQFGFMGFLILPVFFFCLIFYFLFKNEWGSSYLIFMVMFFLWFVGDFWIPQIFLVFFVVFNSVKRKDYA
jgi:O-antigen ligase